MTHQHTHDCKKILKALSAHIDGELETEVCSEIESHLKDCPNCQIVVNTLKKTIHLCQANGREVSLSPTTRQRLFARLGLDDHDNNE
jgi:anti-sigma factor RsiW